jgi:hypothetical protein
MKSPQYLAHAAQHALENPDLVKLAATCMPAGAYNRAMRSGLDYARARSCQFLAMLRRDHPEVFNQVIQSRQAPALAN